MSLAGWSVQYASASGSFSQMTPLSGTILPGHYHLIQESTGGGPGSPLPSPHLVATGVDSFNLSATHVARRAIRYFRDDAVYVDYDAALVIDPSLNTELVICSSLPPRTSSSFGTAMLCCRER